MPSISQSVPAPALARATDARTRLLDAAVGVIRSRGYAAARVEDVCTAAGLSKGAFFHHFASKEDLALAAAAHFSQRSDALFDAASYRQAVDPLARLFAYVDLRTSLMRGDLPDFTCLLGMMVQETYDTSPVIRAACDRYIRWHARAVTKDIAEAKHLHAPRAPWTAESLSLHIQATIQGAFILAKAAGDPQVAVDSMRHLRRYLESSFDLPTQQGD